MRLREFLQTHPKKEFKLTEIARASGMSLSAIRYWTDFKGLPYFRSPGGHRRLPRQSVEVIAASMNIDFS